MRKAMGLFKLKPGSPDQEQAEDPAPRSPKDSLQVLDKNLSENLSAKIPPKGRGIIKAIRAFYRKYPHSSPKKCAEVLGLDYEYYRNTISVVKSRLLKDLGARNLSAKVGGSSQGTLPFVGVPGAHMLVRKGPFWMDVTWFNLLKPFLRCNVRDPAGNFWSPESSWGCLHFNARRVNERGFVWFEARLKSGVADWHVGLRAFFAKAFGRFVKDEQLDALVGLIAKEEGVCELEIKDPYGLPPNVKWLYRNGRLVVTTDHSVWRNGDLVLMGPEKVVGAVGWQIELARQGLDRAVNYAAFNEKLDFMKEILERRAAVDEKFAMAMEDHLSLIAELRETNKALQKGFEALRARHGLTSEENHVTSEALRFDMPRNSEICPYVEDTDEVRGKCRFDGIFCPFSCYGYPVFLRCRLFQVATNPGKSLQGR